MSGPVLVEGLVAALLRPLVAGRVYNDVAPAGVELPYIVIERAGGRWQGYLEGTPPETRHARMQVDVVGRTRAEASALAQGVEDAFVAANHEPLGGPVSQHDPVTGLYGTTQDFSVWWDR